MASRFVTKKRVLKNMWHNAKLSLNVAFVRNDPHATSTAGWRLIFSPVACQLASPRGKHPTPRREVLYNKVKFVFFSTGGPFRNGLARPISAPLGSDDGESTGDPPVASLALALAPWPARRALKVEKIESVSRVVPPAPRGRAGDVKPALRQSDPRKKSSVDPIHLPYE